MTWFRYGSVVLVLAWLGAGVPAAAAGATPDSSGAVSYGTNVTITSIPPGAVVSLIGPYRWVGQTPWNLVRDISGLYGIEARAPGYETWRGDAVFGPGGV